MVFSGLWVAIAAGALTIAVSHGFGARPDALVVALAVLGTFAVYGVDRLRDHERDAGRAPARSAFVQRHRSALIAAAAVSALAAAACAFALGPRAVALSAIAGAVGLLHRRLKHRFELKAGYVAAVWLLVVVGLPALVAGAKPAQIAWVCAVLGPALLSNAIAFNVRDEEALVARIGRRRALALSLGWAAMGLALAAVAPRAVRPLAAVPLATLAAVLGFRMGERYAHVAVDGALIAGAVVAIAL